MRLRQNDRTERSLAAVEGGIVSVSLSGTTDGFATQS